MSEGMSMIEEFCRAECGYYDPDVYCTCPAPDRLYACPLEAETVYDPDAPELPDPDDII